MAEAKNDKGSGDMLRGCLVVVLVIFGVLIFGHVFNTISSKFKKKSPTKYVQPQPPTQSPSQSPTSKNALKASDKIRDWKLAPYEERLALCVGFAVVSNRGQTLKLSAMDFHVCIEEATRGLSQADDLVIMDMAKLCEAEMRK